uniref:Uncharacterized protein n=1 Tax=Cacopsylla melanoneura TaxID=428564 RepID=A0A8D8VJN7_9HEMI
MQKLVQSKFNRTQNYQIPEALCCHLSHYNPDYQIPEAFYFIPCKISCRVIQVRNVLEFSSSVFPLFPTYFLSSFYFSTLDTNAIPVFFVLLITFIFFTFDNFF